MHALTICVASLNKAKDSAPDGCNSSLDNVETIRCLCNALCSQIEHFGDPALQIAIQRDAVKLLVQILSQLSTKTEAEVMAQSAAIHAFCGVVTSKSHTKVGLQSLTSIDGWADLVVNVGMALASELQPSDDNSTSPKDASPADVKRRECIKDACCMIASLCNMNDQCVEQLLNANVLMFLVRAMRFMRRNEQYHIFIISALASIEEVEVKSKSCMSDVNATRVHAAMLSTLGVVGYIGSCLNTYFPENQDVIRLSGRFIVCLFHDRNAPNKILRSCLPTAPPPLAEIITNSFVPFIIRTLGRSEDQNGSTVICRDILIPVARYSHEVASQLIQEGVFQLLLRAMQNQPDNIDALVACLGAIDALVYDGKECRIAAKTFNDHLVSLMQYHSNKAPIACAVMRTVQTLARLPELTSSLSETFLPLFIDVLKEHRAQEAAILSPAATEAQSQASAISTEVVVTAFRTISFLLSVPEVYGRRASGELLSYARDILTRQNDCKLEAEGGPKAKQKAPCAELLCCARALLRQVDPVVQQAESAGQCTQAYKHAETCRNNGPCIAVDCGYCPVCAMSQRLRVCTQCEDAGTKHYCMVCWEKCHKDHKCVEVFLPSSCDM